MDGNRFDELTRALTTGASRRTLLRRLAGGAAGGLLAHLGVREGAAQQCRQPGKLCNKNANCCSFLCDTTNPDPFKRNRCLCPNGVPPVNGSCGPVLGTCVEQPNGAPCSDGNACTQTDICRDGVCVGTNPVVCQPLSPCHLAGTCNPVTGLCTNPTKPNNTPCNDGNACTQTDVCVNGSCVGSNPVICTASDQCHDVGTCNPQTGVCSNPLKPNGSACNDGNACTTGDICTNGVCGGTGVVCPAPDQCHLAGTCDPGTGSCSFPPKPNNTACNADNSLCTQNDTCQAGVCTPGTPVVCTASDQCHDAGACDPATGLCSNPAKANGTACNADNSLCTQNDTCQVGVCTPGTAVVCTASDQCHDAGTCNPATGLCSNPAKANGTACNDGDLCTTGDICTDGVCGGTEVVCQNPDDVCDASTGTCGIICPNDSTRCPGLNGHKDKCCPTDTVCDNSPSGAVNCRNA